MANLIQIKRSAGNTAPSSLSYGELAYSFQSNTFFIGNSSGGVVTIGGYRFVDLLDHTAGTLVASSAVLVNANSWINSLQTGSLRIGVDGGAEQPITSIINDSSLAGVSNNSLASSWALKTYIDAAVTGGGTPITSIGDIADVTTTGAANGHLLVYNNGVWTSTAVGGDATLNRIGQLVIVDGSITSAKIADGTIVNGDISASAGIVDTKLATISTANKVALSSIDLDGATDIGTALLDSHLLFVDAGADGTNRKATASRFAEYIFGKVSGVVTANSAGAFSFVAGSITNAAIAAGTIQNDRLVNSTIIVSNGSTTNSVALGATARFLGTTNQIAVTQVGANLAFAIANNPTLPGNVTVTGDLTVQGDLVTLDVTNISVEDPLIKLAKNNTATDTLDIGLFGTYTPAGTNLYSGLFRDASDSGKWKLFQGLQVEPTTTVNTAGAGYALATLVANIESPSANITGGTISGVTISSLAAPLGAASGGTGLSAFTLNGVLYGSSTTTLAFATGSNGQVLQLNASGVPVFAGLDGGTF